jgi:uncharacterized protein
MGDPIIHVEVAGSDGPALESFYSDLFGWVIDHRGEGDNQYGFLAEKTAGAVGGGIRHEPGGGPEVIFYVQVNDLEESVRQALVLGGSIRLTPTTAGDITFALITDPGGNAVGMVQKKPGD